MAEGSLPDCCPGITRDVHGDIWCLCCPADGTKYSRSLRMNRKALAQQCLTQFELQLARRGLGQAVDISIDRLAEEYLSYAKARNKQSTLDRHDRSRVAGFIECLKAERLQRPSEIRTSPTRACRQKPPESLKPLTVGHCMYAASKRRWHDGRPATTFRRQVARPSGLARFSLHMLGHTFASHLGRERERATGRGIRTALINVSNRVDSSLCPRVAAAAAATSPHLSQDTVGLSDASGPRPRAAR